MPNNDYGIGPIAAQGCMSDLLLLQNSLAPEEIVELINSDRLVMAARPGFCLKFLPIRVQSADEPIMSGGTYLFDTYENALAFDRWVVEEFSTHGVRFSERESILEMSSKAWRVLGAHNFIAIGAEQKIMRVEEWRLPVSYSEDKVAGLWDRLHDLAAAGRYSTLWFLYNQQRHEISIVSTFGAGKIDDSGLNLHKLAELDSIASLLAEGVTPPGTEKIFDRISYVFNIWFPVQTVASSRPSIWPNEFLVPAAD